MAPQAFHALQVFSAPEEVALLGPEEREKTIQKLIKSTGPEGFPPLSLTSQAAISMSEELLVMLVMFIWMGGPLFMFFGGLAVFLLGTWPVKAAYVTLAAFLAYHPMPGKAFTAALIRSQFTRALYKYFSYRFVWCDDQAEFARAHGPWIGTGPPHGVLPFANLIGIPAINTFLGCSFIGTAASVVFHTPVLRYMTLFGVVTVDRKSIVKEIQRGNCVGIVPDGVAGIFRTNRHKELLAMKDKKGVARLALKTGTNVLPAYSYGNTAAFSCWYDRWGILESVSRKAQASLFLYWGRGFLPIPRRVQITMAFGKVIEVAKVENPSEEEVDQLHQKILSATKEMFDLHKHSLGWGDKEMQFV